jgi:hypothetical protein
MLPQKARGAQGPDFFYLRGVTAHLVLKTERGAAGFEAATFSLALRGEPVCEPESSFPDHEPSFLSEIH